MSTVQKSDPALLRKAIMIVVVGIIVGSLLIICFERFQGPFLNWLLSEPEKIEYRLGLFCFFYAVFGSAPLFAFSVYLWSFGDRVMRVQRFPLPGHGVIRDTSILKAQEAVARGRIFKIMAISLGAVGVMLCYAFWWLASTLEKTSS